MNKKKILICTGSFYPVQKGGPDNSLYWLINDYSTKFKNKDITIISFYEKKFKTFYDEKNIYPNKLKNLHSFKSIYFSYYFQRIISLNFIKFIIKDLKKFDLIILNSFFLKTNWLISIVSYLNKKKILLFTRGELEKGALETGSRFKILLAKFISKFVYFKIIGFIATSRKEFKSNSVFLKNKINLIIPNYFKSNYFPQLSKKKKNFIYLGRIHPKKNLELMIRSFNNFLLFNKSNDRLLIYGTGKKNYIKQLKKIITSLKVGSQIIFKGTIYGNKKYDILSSHKALILLSKSENFGNVILESLFSGTEVIISNNLPWKNSNFIHKVKPAASEISEIIRKVSSKSFFEPDVCNKYIVYNFMNTKIIDDLDNYLNDKF